MVVLDSTGRTQIRRPTRVFVPISDLLTPATEDSLLHSWVGVCPLNSCCIDKESLWKWLFFNHMGSGLKVACEMQYKCKHSGCAECGGTI